MRELSLVIMTALITFLLRSLPFLIFNRNKELPAVIHRLSKQLPMAIMILLVIYCARNVQFDAMSNWFPVCSGIVLTAMVHAKWKNVLISIAIGTFWVMALLQFVF